MFLIRIIEVTLLSTTFIYVRVMCFFIGFVVVGWNMPLENFEGLEGGTTLSHSYSANFHKGDYFGLG